MDVGIRLFFADKHFKHLILLSVCQRLSPPLLRPPASCEPGPSPPAPTVVLHEQSDATRCVPRTWVRGCTERSRRIFPNPVGYTTTFSASRHSADGDREWSAPTTGCGERIC